MSSQRRGPLSQHFLRNRELVERLVRASSISPRDLVLEIGPGRGTLTRALLQSAQRVIAVERDVKLYGWLRRHLPHPRLELIHADFRAVALPQEPYKVFSNIPFSITGEIIRKLLQADPPPTQACLIVQHEAAGKFVPNAHSSTLAAVLYYPWWEICVTHRFRRTDFSPPPSVDSVLLNMQMRAAPLVATSRQAAYQDYVADRFGRDKNARHLAPAQFVGAFTHFMRSATGPQRRAIRGAFSRLLEQQAGLQKIHRSRTDPNWKRFGSDSN